VSFTLDHVFVMCSAGALAEAEALAARGIKEGEANRHPGQGTACRRFFFGNAYLELVWVEDPEEAQSELVLPTRIFERWAGRDAGACPFGIIGRPSDPAGSAEPPFETWPYRPKYLAPTLAIDIAVETPLDEPEWFWLGFAHARGRQGAGAPEHALPLRNLRHLRIEGPVLPVAKAARIVAATGLVSFAKAPRWRMELVFEGRGKSAVDLRPVLPVSLRW
jgi:hypothetical protein